MSFREGALFETHDHGEEHHDDGHDKHDDDEHAHEEEPDDAHDDHGDSHEEHAHDDDHEDHAGGNDEHAHGAHDPHAWLSPDNAAVWLNAIAAALSAADPDNAATYYANAAAGREELSVLTGEIETLLGPVRGSRFVVFHDAYQYFEAAFDIPASGAITLGDASDPSPARLAEIQERVAKEGIVCVLSEPQYNQNLVATVMDGTQANTGIMDPLGTGIEPGPALYPQLLQNLADSLAGCL